MRKKIFTILLALAASVGMMNAKVTWDSSNISGFYVMGSNGSYSKEGVTLSANAEYVNAQWQSSTDDISFTTNETGGFTFSNTLDKNFTKIEMTLDYLGAWYSANLGSGWSSSDGDYLMNEPSTVTWTGNASTVDLLKDEYDFDGEHVKSIVFYFEGDETDGPATYTLRILADPEKGSVALQNPSSDIVLNYDGTYTVPENAEVTILATPLEGYEFSGWRVGSYQDMCYYDYCGGDVLNTNDNPLTVTMTADVAYVADFAAAASDPANPIAVENGTKDGFSYTLYDNGLLEISGSGAMPNHAFVEEDFSADVKNIRFAKDCEVYSLGDMWFRCYDSKYSQLETVEINSVVPISFLGEGIFYKQESAVTITITAPGIVNVESEIVGNYYSPVNMIFNVPATTVFEKNWFLRNQSYYAITIPTGATGHVPASLAFTDPDKQSQYDDAVEMGNEEWFWDMFGDGLKEGVDYNKVEESTFVITAENASQIFGPATVYFQDPEPQPQPAQDVNITPYEDPENPTVYYSTFYDSEVKYLLPENVEAYVATLNGANLLLSKIADAGQTIPADNAVILKSTVTPFTLSISDAEAVPVNAINSLQGTDVSIATPANCYVLAGNDGVGFYHYTASMLNPHKAYVIYSGSQSSAPRRMPFVFEVATGVENIQPSAVSSQKVFRDGQLVIIRNGVEYNAAGQMVK